MSLISFFIMERQTMYEFLLYLKITRQFSEHGTCTIHCDHSRCRNQDDHRDSSEPAIVEFQSYDMVDKVRSVFTIETWMTNRKKIVAQKHFRIHNERQEGQEHEAESLCNICKQRQVWFHYNLHSLYTDSIDLLQESLSTQPSSQGNTQKNFVFFQSNSSQDHESMTEWFVSSSTSESTGTLDGNCSKKLIQRPRFVYHQEPSIFSKYQQLYIARPKTPRRDPGNHVKAAACHGDKRRRGCNLVLNIDDIHSSSNIACLFGDAVTLQQPSSGGACAAVHMRCSSRMGSVQINLPCKADGSLPVGLFPPVRISCKQWKNVSSFGCFYESCELQWSLHRDPKKAQRQRLDIDETQVGKKYLFFAFSGFQSGKVAQSDLKWLLQNLPRQTKVGSFVTCGKKKRKRSQTSLFPFLSQSGSNKPAVSRVLVVALAQEIDASNT